MTAAHLCPVCQHNHNNAPNCPNCAFDLSEYTFANTRTQKDLVAQHLARWQPESCLTTPPVTPVVNPTASANSHTDDTIAVIEYRAAVKMAWADQKLEAFEIKHLQQQADSLKLSPAQTEAIEREVIGRSVREQRYYATLQELSHDFSLTSLQAIPELQQELGLSADLEQQLEQTTFGQTLLEKVLQQQFQALQPTLVPQSQQTEQRAQPSTANNDKMPPSALQTTATGQTIGHFIAYDNGTATDTHHGLMWCRFSIGQLWQNGTATGEVTKMSWEEALQSPKAMNASYFAGFNDWRLPTIDELTTLITQDQSPTIDTTVFPNTPNRSFWSSSPHAGGYACLVNFNYGKVSNCRRHLRLPVRLVRTSQ